MKYIINTLGCKVNQFETQAMETLLKSRGHVPVQEGELADTVIVNSCAVTAESGRKSRQAIRRLRSENPGALMAVLGCYSQLSPGDVEALGADLVFGTGDREELINCLEERVRLTKIENPFQRREFERLPAGALEGRTRAMLKIQDGCVNFCSYCIIPYTRGRLRSLPIDEAVFETGRLAEEGYGELVLTGIEIASYGLDLPGKPSLAELLDAISGVSGSMRLRLGSLEPSVLTEDFCRRLSGVKGLCRHFHLSLQSGCDKILRAMNRKYDTACFFEAVRRLRRYFPLCAVYADLIVGFPGETESDALETLSFIEKCAFSDMHIFPYSRRPGTPADKLPGQFTRAEKEERAARAQTLAAAMRRNYLDSCVGKCFPVLFESRENDLSKGHSDTYVPVAVEEDGLHAQTCSVLIECRVGDMLYGRLSKKKEEECYDRK